ncbi:Flavodoxin reductase [Labilithrix luteola]|uniref:Flavodoxin reductase n=1 Tax=Labilithrix luteola TaxID=1391654 RepID=A0A0K1PZY0_9BACT|nr:ferredoxin reductase [Labilithrix luteola]AKU99090.1 Flavodoxin reductase [Labilithrix luteola]
MHPFLQKLAVDHHVEFWLGELDRSWSVRTLRGRVLDVIHETHDVKSFRLRANRLWKGHRAGQFVTVDVELDGVRTRRCYSIASAPAPDGRTFSLTVKRAGRVSSWLHDNVVVGDVLELGSVAGTFVMPAHAQPARILFVSGGSGITPLMSMLRDLASRNAIADLVFLHAARSESDVIFAAELADLAARHLGLRLALHCGPLDGEALRKAVPDFAERDTFMCGPPGMMTGLAPSWTGIEDRLKTERFYVAPARADVETGTNRRAGARKVRLTMAGSGTSLEVDDSLTLLEHLERAGHTPKSGCRMGICNTCVCRKESGVVENTTTGELSADPNHDIRLCSSRAHSDIVLSL